MTSPDTPRRPTKPKSARGRLDRRTSGYRAVRRINRELAQDQARAPYITKQNQHVEVQFDETGQSLTVRRVPQCRACMCDTKGLPNGEVVAKFIINSSLIGAPIMQIHKSIRPLMDAWPRSEWISYDALARHFRNQHLPFEVQGARKAVEARAREAGLDIEQGVQSIYTILGAMDIVKEKALKVLELTNPSGFMDALKALLIADKVETEMSGGITIERMKGQLAVVMMAVWDVLPPDQFGRFHERIEFHRRGLPMPAESMSSPGTADPARAILNRDEKTTAEILDEESEAWEEGRASAE